MLNKLAVDLAQAYYAQGTAPYDEDDIELYVYGIEVFVQNVLEVLALMIVGLLIGRFWETVAFFAAFIPLRVNAGGYHAKNALRCFMVVLMVHAAFLVVVSVTPVWLSNYLSLFVVLPCIAAVLNYAPLEHKNRPVGPIQRKKFRKKSLVVILVQATIIVGTSLAGMGLSFIGADIADIVPALCFSFALGQLSAAGSLVVAKIQNAKGGELDVC